MSLENSADQGLSPLPKHKKVRLLPADLLGQRFCEIFPYSWQFIYAPMPVRGQKPEWQTETRFPLEPRNLWARWQDPNQLIGVRFGKETSYGMADIDVDSPYHFNQDPNALGKLLATLESIGLCRTLIVRSGDSGGLHVYFPLERPVPSYGLALAVKWVLENNGFQVAQGQLELFPNTKVYKQSGFTSYNAHRLPLQPGAGSCLLNQFGEEIGGRLDQFLDIWEMAANGNDVEQLQESIEAARQCNKVVFFSGRSNKADQWRQDDQAIIQQGWTGPGQTNEILKAIARYGVVWEALTGDDLVNYVEQRATKAPGYQEFCNHQHEIRRRAQEWSVEAEKYYSPYCSFPNRTGNFHNREGSLDNQENVIPFNQRIAEEAQERIRQAITSLEQQGTLPEGADARAKILTTQARCSRRTLYKYPALWHPEQYQPKEVGTSDVEPVSEFSCQLANFASNQPKSMLDAKLESFVPTQPIRRWGSQDLVPFVQNSFFSDQSPRRLPLTVHYANRAISPDSPDRQDLLDSSEDCYAHLDFP